VLSRVQCTCNIDALCLQSNTSMEAMGCLQVQCQLSNLVQCQAGTDNLPELAV
jgi:hypothetical protein